MRAANRVRRYGILPLALLGLSVIACRPGADAEAAEDSVLERVVNVETITVEPESFRDQITVTGTVRADRDVVVASEEAGVIREVYVERGRRVSAGQPIAKIDDELIQAQHDQAQAQAALARETYERRKRLWEEDSIGSELAYLQARYGAETAEANARALATRLERTTVRAPIGGVLDERLVEVGSTVAPGSPVARVIDTNPLTVEMGVPERYVGEIENGTTARVSADNATVDGRVNFVGTALDEESRTFTVEVVIPRGATVLKPGMVVRVDLSRGELQDAILVPRDAVLRAESGYIVYVVVAENGSTVAEARTVITGVGEDGRVVIEDGLESGDRVIVVGQQQVTAGDRVNAVNTGTGGAK